MLVMLSIKSLRKKGVTIIAYILYIIVSIAVTAKKTEPFLWRYIVETLFLIELKNKSIAIENNREMIVSGVTKKM